jgi:hypothetical protein
MTSYLTSWPAASARLRLVARAGLLTGAIALTSALFAQPIMARADYDDKYYRFCLDSIGQGVDYCCAHAGGIVNSGACMDPASLAVTGPTITRRNSPPIVIVPTAP